LVRNREQILDKWAVWHQRGIVGHLTRDLARIGVLGALAGYRDAKLLDRIEWNGQHGVETGDRTRAVGVRSLAIVLVMIDENARVLVVIHVDAVQRDVVLVSPGSQHFATGRDSRLQAQQLNHIARLKR
jgi:hypothetical protein